MDVTASARPEPVVTLALVPDFELRYDDVPVAVPATSRRLLGLLALSGAPVPRALVGATLWPEADERHAAASLRSALWRIPVVPGPPLVGTRGCGLGLGEHVVVDLHELLRDTQAILATRTPPARLLGSAAALRLLGHDLLTGWYDDWVVDERQRFRQLRLYSLDVIGHALLEQHRTGEALQLALALVETDPLRESGHRLLLDVHLQEGNVAEAVRQYERYAHLLERELRVRPSDLMTAQLRRFRTAAARPAGTAVTAV
jgi:DNA-binding SARP family transcriptional activator